MNMMHRIFSSFIQPCSYFCLTLVLWWCTAPLYAVSDENQSAVDLDVTAYVSWDGGTDCTGYSQVYGRQGDYVTLCFAVTNIGDGILQNIRIVDEATRTLATYEPALLPSSTVVLWYQGVIGTGLPTEVTVQAQSRLQSNLDLSPTFSKPDFSTIAVQQKNPEIELKQTIYLGHDGGAGCHGSNRIEAISGQPLTYCFEVINTGDTSLDDIQLFVPTLSINIDDLVRLNGKIPLGPNESQLWYYETNAVGNLTTIARAQANPADAQGNDLVGLHNEPYADVSATVRTPTNMPGIMVLKTGYIGENGGAHCPGTNLVRAIAGDVITYCFEIVNTGTTDLYPIQISDTNLDLDEVFKNSVVPQSRFPLFSSASIEADILNVASASGNGVDENGIDLPGLADPIDEDRVLVDIVSPALAFQKSVYIGHDGGERCPGVSEVTSYHDDFVTYCYIVKNIGDIYLSDITIEDPTLGIDEKILTAENRRDILAPGEEAIWYHETGIDGETTQPAIATANPTDKAGLDIPDLPNPSAESTANARLEAGLQGFSVRHSLYMGRDSGASCPGAKRLVAPYGTDITYCVVIANNGSEPLKNLTIKEEVSEIDQLNMILRSGSDPLAPGEHLVYYYEDKQENIIESQISVATEDGVEGSDSAFATIANSELLLEKTVYPNHNGGVFCPGSKRATGVAYESITYCFRVINQGNTYLDNLKILNHSGIEIDNSKLMVLRGSLPLAPGQEIIYYYHTELVEDIRDVTSVTAQVTDPAGNPLPGVEMLRDSDEISLEYYVSIGDRVWYDANANGLQDRGEEGIADVLVTLHYQDGRSVDRIRTNADGHFHFDRVSPGEYYLKIEQPEGHLFTAQDVGEPNATEILDSDVDPQTGRTPTIIFTSGDGNRDLDAGLLEAASIGNRVWLDENGDGMQGTGETGVSNIVVELYKVNSSVDVVLVDTTVTDEQGLFRFSNLEPGRYTVDVPLGPQSGYSFSQQDAGASDELDSDIDPESGRSSQTLLESGENDDSWDVGLFSAPQITLSIDNDGVDAHPGESIEYTIDYANSGSTVARDVVLTKSIPAYTSFDAEASTTDWICTASIHCRYELNTVGAQEAKKLLFAVKVDDTLPNAAYIYKHDLTISYRGENPNSAIPALTQSVTSQVRFRTPQIIDLRNFEATLVEDMFHFNWTLDGASGLDGFHINVSGDGQRENAQHLTTEMFTEEAVVQGNQLHYEYQHVADEATAGGIHANTFWLVAFDGQGNGVEYGPFLLQGSTSRRQYSLFLPWISLR